MAREEIIGEREGGMADERQRKEEGMRVADEAQRRANKVYSSPTLQNKKCHFH